MTEDLYLLPAAPLAHVDAYLEWGGGRGIARAVELGPEAVIEEVRASGLRGRGGGGFPTGAKWASVRGDGAVPVSVVGNGAEGEPATFKDRTLLRRNPYQVVEGLVIAAFAVGADRAVLAVKASFEREREALERAAIELQQAGICTDCAVEIVGGPEDYLFGEETALLEVVEGRLPLPKVHPPYVEGLGAGPGRSTRTAVNNVETLAQVPMVLSRGADWFRSMGTENSPGHAIATVVGDVRTPGVGEIELGTTLRSVIDAVGGGPAPGRAVKAVLAGVANPVITAAMLDTPVSYEHLSAAGAGMGAVGFAVYDDTACMIQLAHQVSNFLAVESCGQCPPCKLGSAAITDLLADLHDGQAGDRTLDQLAAQLERVTDANRCYLGTQERMVVSSILQRFPDEVAEHLAGGCAHQRTLTFPKLTEL